MSLLPVGIGGARSGYEIEKSLRFRASASAYLSRTIAASSNRKTQTISMWVKRGSIGSGQQVLFGHYQDPPNNQYILRFLADDTLALVNVQSNTINASRVTTRTFRDPSAWYHIVGVFDTTNSTAGDRVKLYVNGVQETSFSTAINPALNTDLMINSASQPIGIGREVPSRAGVYAFFDGYMSEINFIDGQALDPSYFGKTDPATGQWVPKKYVGSYGTNGFYLDFKEGTNLTTLGYDKSGNGNNWTLNNISLTAGVTYDWMDDTPTNNFAVLNPLVTGAAGSTMSEGNLRATFSASVARIIPVSSYEGKWYCEFTPSTAGDCWGGLDSIYRSNGQRYNGAAFVAYGATYTANDVIGCALDADAGTVEFFKNGASQGVIPSLSSGGYIAANVYGNGGGISIVYNFGQRPFTYSPPAGFKALCTKNLTSDDVIESGTFTGNANADGPFVWCNGTPETLTINGNAVTWGTHADRLANGFKLRTASTSYNAVGSNSWTATILSPEKKSAFRNQRAKGNP